jgi:hypothetical protein
MVVETQVVLWLEQSIRLDEGESFEQAMLLATPLCLADLALAFKVLLHINP